ncbi:hypothetical protein OH77DRAFT_1426774 [Trametes cingulata]|nr:hypothetical protein OH77DRAFT_1426774 [Trametes cingulata]
MQESVHPAESEAVYPDLLFKDFHAMPQGTTAALDVHPSESASCMEHLLAQSDSGYRPTSAYADVNLGGQLNYPLHQGVPAAPFYASPDIFAPGAGPHTGYIDPLVTNSQVSAFGTGETAYGLTMPASANTSHGGYTTVQQGASSVQQGALTKAKRSRRIKNSGDSQKQEKVRKHSQRTPTACEPCHKYKRKCDGESPCGPCRKREREMYCVRHVDQRKKQKGSTARIG